MSKVYNKIVQSNTEPSKNDIWLKDGQMKAFGKEGWKSVGGGSSLDANTPYIFNYTGQTTVTQDEYDGLKNAIENHQIILCKYHDVNMPVSYGLNNGNILISFTVEVSLFIFQITPSLELMENIRIFVTSDDLDVNDLNDYLASLEDRIATLESANA